VFLRLLFRSGFFFFFFFLKEWILRSNMSQCNKYEPLFGSDSGGLSTLDGAQEFGLLRAGLEATVTELA